MKSLSDVAITRTIIRKLISLRAVGDLIKTGNGKLVKVIQILSKSPEVYLGGLRAW